MRGGECVGAGVFTNTCGRPFLSLGHPVTSSSPQPNCVHITREETEALRREAPVSGSGFGLLSGHTHRAAEKERTAEARRPTYWLFSQLRKGNANLLPRSLEEDPQTAAGTPERSELS